MSKHVAFLNEGLAAIRTAVRSLVRMRSSVRYQVSFAHKVFRTKIATERSLRVASFIVRTHVEEEVALQREALAALCANEWAFTGMTSHVIDEMFLSRERLGANVATVRRFSGMLT